MMLMGMIGFWVITPHFYNMNAWWTSVFSSNVTDNVFLGLLFAGEIMCFMEGVKPAK